MKSSRKIFINTLPTIQTSGGILTFLLELLYALADNNNSQLNYCLICSEINEHLFIPFKKYSNFSVKVVKVDNSNPIKRIFYEQFVLPKFLNTQKNAVVLNICNVAMLRCKIPQITIIQAQLSIAKLRKTLPKDVVCITTLHKIYYDTFLERSIRKSTKTIAISNYMVQFLKKYEDKLAVIHEGVNFNFFANPDKNIKQNSRPYILSLSTLFPHKNMNRVIEAFSIFIKSTNLDFDLLIVGKDPDGRQMPKLKELAEKLGIANRVIFKGWIATDEIPGIYANATIFLYLSSMEFFGLPVLEAMAAEVPVIAANKMSIPEVVNNAGILVEPDDVENVSRHIEHIVKNEQYKKNLVAAGRENIKNFDWHFTAKKFETLFLNAN
ncbi:MAG: glycosyltransferase family 4 protein [Parafilimonas sp.]|nr:glycosyltransferase family 4 protein [Parafilimonas sp.]